MPWLRRDTEKTIKLDIVNRHRTQHHGGTNRPDPHAAMFAATMVVHVPQTMMLVLIG